MFSCAYPKVLVKGCQGKEVRFAQVTEFGHCYQRLGKVCRGPALLQLLAVVDCSLSCVMGAYITGLSGFADFPANCSLLCMTGAHNMK